ncbi:TIGR00645 family protein [Ancylobacter sp. WKF20]|uniref:TIGR00645 family protein n=1 Tax=Ancylobacter sp. WKF20 TaxID=3039801 RepID=UPI002434345D|nr:TIGR00645 family protein [Ancylobacter sp. WKF20]WGD29965.1 TIGR00645 family protein [Ancylobacter sp. WKF20]
MQKLIERFIFISRWIMAPFYIGLVIALLVLLFKFGHELFHFVTHAYASDEADIILGLLALIDLTFTGSLVIIVIFSGYENFVSRIDAEGHENWPEWMTKVDFAGLKQKLLASIVAISAIALLKAFMNLDKGVDEKQLMWLVIIHMVFVVSGVVLAWTDRLSEKGH